MRGLNGFLGGVLLAGLICAGARGHSAVEVFIGRSGAGELHAHAHLDEAVILPRSVFPGITGFATPSIGFESLEADEPLEDLFRLAPAAQIVARFEAIDSGITVYDGPRIVGVGETIAFGELPFDNHPIFAIAPGTAPGTPLSVRVVFEDQSLLYTASHGVVIMITPACPADVNLSESTTVQDIFDFLGYWFAGLPQGDFNGSGESSVQDIFDFLAAWFAGC